MVGGDLGHEKGEEGLQGGAEVSQAAAPAIYHSRSMAANVRARSRRSETFSAHAWRLHLRLPGKLSAALCDIVLIRRTIANHPQAGLV
jgi:hypothetical protein